jgi:hypothetical protein
MTIEDQCTGIEQDGHSATLDLAVAARGLRLTELATPIDGARNSLYLSISTLSSLVKEAPLDYKREGQPPRKGDRNPRD